MRSCRRQSSFSLLIIVFLFAKLSSACGGSSAAGGVSIRYQLNPWFLQNTKEITYCIDVELENFSASAEQVDKNFRAAFRYWKNHLAFALDDENELLKIATQKLVRVSCGAHTNPDISLQMGNLLREQAVFLPQNHQFVALAQITDYEEPIMHGKGFIFVTGDNESSVGPHQWSLADGHALEMTFVHELGHIFGFRHESGIEVMKEDFPDEMFNLGEEQLSQENIFRRLKRIENPLARNNEQRILLSLSSDLNEREFHLLKKIFPHHILDKFILEFQKDEKNSQIQFFTSSKDGVDYHYLDRAKMASYIPKKTAYVEIKVPKSRSIFLGLAQDRVDDQIYHGYHFVLQESHVLRLNSRLGEKFFIANYFAGQKRLQLQIIDEGDAFVLGDLSW